MQKIIVFIKKNLITLPITILLAASIVFRIYKQINKVHSSSITIVHVYAYYIQLIALIMILAYILVVLFKELPMKLLTIGLAMQVLDLYVNLIIIYVSCKYDLSNIPIKIYYIINITLPYVVIIGLWKRKFCIMGIVMSLCCIAYKIFNGKIQIINIYYLLFSIYVMVLYNQEFIYNSICKFIELLKSKIKFVKKVKVNIGSKQISNINNEIETLKKLKELYDEGIITKKEFELKKKQALKLNNE